MWKVCVPPVVPSGYVIKEGGSSWEVIIPPLDSSVRVVSERITRLGFFEFCFVVV